MCAARGRVRREVGRGRARGLVIDKASFALGGASFLLGKRASPLRGECLLLGVAAISKSAAPFFVVEDVIANDKGRFSSWQRAFASRRETFFVSPVPFVLVRASVRESRTTFLEDRAPISRDRAPSLEDLAPFSTRRDALRAEDGRVQESEASFLDQKAPLTVVRASLPRGKAPAPRGKASLAGRKASPPNRHASALVRHACVTVTEVSFALAMAARCDSRERAASNQALLRLVVVTLRLKPGTRRLV